MAFVDFALLTPNQRSQARGLRPKWADEQFARMRFWVRPNGYISRRAGHHEITAAAGKEIDDVLAGRAARSKTDLADWNPGTTFHQAPEKTGPIGWGRGMFIAGAAAGVTPRRKSDRRQKP